MNVTPLQLERSLVQAFAVFAKHPKFQLTRDMDHTRTYSGINEAFLNNVFETKDSLPLTPARLREITDHFAGHNFIWRLGPSTSNVEAVAEALIDFGLVYVGTSPGMLLTSEKKVDSAGLNFITVKDEADLKAWFNVWQEGFGMTDAAGAYCLDLYGSQKFFLDPAFHLVYGTFEGKPVTCGNTYDDGICTGLYNITTLLGFRSRGFGAALTSRCIEDARKKSKRPLYLYSSPQGFSLYESLGFETMVELEQLALVNS